MRPILLLLSLVTGSALAVDVISSGGGDGTVTISQDKDRQYSVGDSVCVPKVGCGEVVKASALDATVKLKPNATPLPQHSEKRAVKKSSPVEATARAAPKRVPAAAAPAPSTPAAKPIETSRPVARKEPADKHRTKHPEPEPKNMKVHPYRLTIEGETVFSDSAPPVMDEGGVTRAPSHSRDTASLAPLKWRFGPALDFGTNFLFPGLEVQRIIGASTALGLHVVMNYQEERGTQRIVGGLLSLTVFLAESTINGLFAETRLGLFSLAARDALGEEATTSYALAELVGWRARLAPYLSLGAAIGGQYLYQPKATRILTFNGVMPLFALELSLQF